jgi:hypothetical protein
VADEEAGDEPGQPAQNAEENRFTERHAGDGTASRSLKPQPFGYLRVMLTVNVRRDPQDDLIDLVLAGRLDVSTAQTVRAALLKCVVEHPRAILVDVNRVSGRDAAWTVFPAVQRTAAFQDMQIAVLLHTRSSTLGSQPDMVVFPDRESAAAAVGYGQHPRRRWLHLPANVQSGANAYSFVADACADWNLSDLAEVAAEVAEQLVTNSVLQAGTDMVVTVHLGPGYLHLNVHDFRREPPRLPYRGLTLVDAVTAGWGTFLTGDGKHVWANFPLVQAQLAQ